MPVARDEPVGHARKWSKRRQNQRRQDEDPAPVSKRGDDRSLGGQHPAIDTDPLESRRAALLVEVERLKIKSLPRGHGRDAKPSVGETGRGRAEPAVAVIYKEGLLSLHTYSIAALRNLCAILRIQGCIIILLSRQRTSVLHLEVCGDLA